MNIDAMNRDRYCDESPINNDSSRPDLVTCPHCRGTGVVLKSKLSSGQLRKIELDEAAENGAVKPRPLIDIPPSAGLEIIPYQKRDEAIASSSSLSRNEAFNSRREASYVKRGGDYFGNDPGPGPSRSGSEFFRRSDPDWFDNNVRDDDDDDDDDNNKWVDKRDYWRSGGGATWRGLPPPAESFDYYEKRESVGFVDDPLTKKRKRKKKKNNWSDKGGKFEFGNEEWNVAGPGKSHTFAPPFANNQPRSLMSDRVSPPNPIARPLPSSSSSYNVNQGPRKRSRGPNYDNMPTRDELSDVDIFSLGVLYGNYMK